jgi:hypothetical protein
MSTLQILRIGKVFCAATSGNVLLEYWNGDAQVSDYMEQRELQRAQVARIQGKVACITYVATVKLKPLNAESRKIMQERAQELANKLAATAIILPQKGLSAAIVRGILASVNLVVRQPIETEVFADLPNAYAWLKKFCAIEPIALDAAVQDFIAQAKAAS